jgi:hypothetical protein
MFSLFSSSQLCNLVDSRVIQPSYGGQRKGFIISHYDNIDTIISIVSGETGMLETLQQQQDIIPTATIYIYIHFTN